MLTIIQQIAVNDPVAMIELFSLLAVMLFLIKFTLLPPTGESWRRQFQLSAPGDVLSTIFGVGAAIPARKRSLRMQRPCFQRAC